MFGAIKAWAAIQTVLLALLRLPNRSGNGIKQSVSSLVSFELYERRKGETGGEGRQPHFLAAEWSFVEEGQTLADFGQEF